MQVSCSLYYSKKCIILCSFQPCDSFIGYQADTSSAVVFTASRENGMTEDQIERDSQTWESKVSLFCILLLCDYLIITM